MKNIEIADIIALVLIIGCFALKVMGIDGTLNYVLVTVSSFYFGFKTRHVIRQNKQGGE